ncbi:MAG: MarR family transcriptional regulator [Clostridia bacterium]|nr:MarR family transcriptional regulator [Clostridia bacterium]
MDLDERLMTQFRRASAQSRRMHRETSKDQAHPDGRHVRGMGHILEALDQKEGVSQKALAESVGVRPQSISEALILLEERGEIRREVSPLDRRVTLVYLTERGAEKREQRRVLRTAHAHRYFQPLTRDEKEVLMQLLTKLCDEENGKEEV